MKLHLNPAAKQPKIAGMTELGYCSGFIMMAERPISVGDLIESVVRFRVDELFKQAGIVIAFPQRDIHIDTQRPLEFRLIDSKN